VLRNQKKVHGLTQPGVFKRKKGDIYPGEDTPHVGPTNLCRKNRKKGKITPKKIPLLHKKALKGPEN